LYGIDTLRITGQELTRWLPSVGSAILMAMVAVGASMTFDQLKQSVYWRKHSYEVLICSQAMFADLMDSQRGMRGYVLTQRPESLATYRQAIERLPQRVDELRAIVSDNPSQVKRAARIADDLRPVIDYSHKLLGVRKTRGLQAVMDLEALGEGRLVVDHLRADLDDFSAEEHRLLLERDTGAQSAFRSTSDLLVIGSVLAVALLLFAHLLTSREARRRRHTESELRLSEQRFRHAFDDAPIGMCLVHPQGRFIKVNRVLSAMLGYSQSALCELDFQSITHPEDLQTDLGQAERMLRGEIPSYQLEKRYLHRDGSVLFANLHVSLVRNEDNEPLYFVVQIEDIAYRREMDRLKREFVSTVSHELRTPLTSIRGSLGLVSAGVLGPLPEKAHSMVRIAYQNSERLVRIINDILDVEKIESGKLELRPESLEVHDVLSQALEENRAYGDKYKVSFVLQGPSHVGLVKADPDRLMQVMSNLLSNAAKFSPAGSQVEVRTRAEGSSVRIEVQDYGTGIPEKFRSRIFEKFAQADGSSARRFDGTGLGLSITRQLVEAMGGSIGFTTEADQGTTFHFLLPSVAIQNEAALAGLSLTARHRVLILGEGAHPDQVLRRMPRILHVEDDLDLSQVVEAALAGRAEVVAAPTLQSAQEQLQAGQFSLVVLDLNLPDGNGLSLLDSLQGSLPNPVPVVILSVTEVSRAVQDRVAATLVKSKMSEAEVVRTILSLVPEEA
jgi:PAS domain S-box-containing protein